MDGPICKAEIDTNVENKPMETKAGRGAGMNWEIGIDIYPYSTMSNTDN